MENSVFIKTMENTWKQCDIELFMKGAKKKLPVVRTKLFIQLNGSQKHCQQSKLKKSIVVINKSVYPGFSIFRLG